MFSGFAEIARVAQQLLKTRVILILNFTRPHAITYTKPLSAAAISEVITRPLFLARIYWLLNVT